MTGYKLLRKRRDGSYGTLFINRKLKLYPGIWYPAEDHPTSGFAHRPGWHVLPKPESNRLALKDNRVWCLVLFDHKETINKPLSQGGPCYIGNSLMIVEEVGSEGPGNMKECPGDWGLTCEECGLCEAIAQ